MSRRIGSRQIVANCSRPLVEVCRRGLADVDAIKIPTRFSEECELKTVLCGKPALVHGHSTKLSIGDDYFFQRLAPSRLRMLLRYSVLSYASLHLEVSQHNEVDVLGDEFQNRTKADLLELCVVHVDYFQRSVGLHQVGIENVSRTRGKKVCACSFDPIFLGEVVGRTDSVLVFDIAHALVTHGGSKAEAIDFLSELPRDRIAEIHVSGPYCHPVYGWVDAHLEPDIIVWDLLEEVLRRCDPSMLVLEYGGGQDSFEVPGLGQLDYPRNELDVLIQLLDTLASFAK